MGGPDVAASLPQCGLMLVACTVAVLKCSVDTAAFWVVAGTQPTSQAQDRSHRATFSSCVLQVGQALLTIPYSMAQLGMAAGVVAQVSWAEEWALWPCALPAWPPVWQHVGACWA